MKNTLTTLFLFMLLSGCLAKNSDSAAETTDSTRIEKEAGKPGEPAESNQNTADAAQFVDAEKYSELQRYLAAGDTTGKWPVQKDVIPLKGAILPFNRVIAYYGNLYSTRMGILGELPKDSMFKRLQAEIDNWNRADSSVTAIPALHYIAVTAQKAGRLKRLRMPFHQIDTIVTWAKEINALVFLDVQVGHSKIQDEMKEFEKYFAMPNVHFGIDPEFAMRDSAIPGSEIGTYDAKDINDVADYLAGIVRKYNLPPKILVIHRFTADMVTNYQEVKLRPEVQIVLQMDGWGNAAKKMGTYKRHVQAEPIQFTGFKIFYYNDTRRSRAPRIMTPEEVLKLTPDPVYIQYQ